MIAPAQPARARNRIGVPIAVAVVIVALFVLADRITKALAANDMRPVEPEFNALRRPQLESHGKVGRLSDFVNREGAFKRTKEDTPKDAPAGYHHFIAQFEKGNLSEDLTLDGDGKVANFHVRPLDAQ